ncbi:MAG: glycosyltransferase [Thermoanaerobaculia bacterium]
MKASRPPHARIIVDESNDAWIFGKMARRLAENLPNAGWVASVAAEPSADADVNHWMLYSEPWTKFTETPGFFEENFRLPGQHHTVTITHIDDALKLRALADVVNRLVSAGICISRMTAETLGRWGIDSQKLRVVLPATDAAAEPRRIVLGITSKVYPDGRKREGMLVDVARRISLSAFRFEIFGRGWEIVIPELEKAGAEVRYDPGTEDAVADYERIRAALPYFDYYVYLGEDEGSMGFLDAVAAGVKTIVTPQGFHLDIPGGITHPVTGPETLQEVLQEIPRGRDRLSAAGRARTWAAYANEHARIWEELLRKTEAVAPDFQPHRTMTDRERRTLWRNTLRAEPWVWRSFIRNQRFRVRALLSSLKHRFVGARHPD